MMIGSTLNCAVAIFIVEGAFIHGHLLSKIDNYIDKLLTSQKFEQLVERIANKAVEKMLNQQPNLRMRPTNETLSLQKKTVFNISHETDVHIEETPLDYKNLSLKYKHFAKVPLHKEKIGNSNQILNKTKLNISKLISNSNEFKEDIDYFQSSDFESKQKKEIIESGNHEEVNKLDDSEQLKEKPSNEKKEWTVEETKVTEDSISMENQKNEVFLESDSNSIERENSKPVGHISEFDNNVEKDKSLFENPKIETKSSEPKKNRKKRFRKEGNRIFTFMSSSDYDEYHQELDKIETKRKVYI